MAAAVLAAARKLDLSSVTKDDKIGLVKETSTVGDLISFTDRRISPVRQVHRRRGSTGNADITNFRRKSLQRSDSEKSLSQRSRKSSVSVAWESENVSPDLDTSRLRTSRRNSMMNALRDDLGKVPCLTALKKRPSLRQASVDENEYDDPFNPSDSDDDRISPYRRKSTRRSSNMIRRESRLSSSSESTSGILTEAEQRKLRMLQTLNTMNGGNKCNYKRNNSIDSQGEIAILEASYGRGKKRGSIATHVLMKTRHKKGPLTDLKTNKAEVILGSPSPVEKSDNEIMSEEQRDRSMKMFQMLKKNEKPKLIGLVGKPKDSITKEDVAKESILSFRRRLKRKRTKPIDIWRKRARFLVLLLRAWKIHSNAINEDLVDNNDSLDMITRGNQADLLFDITSFKASKEAKISSEVKRILMKKPGFRTEEEQYYVQIFLRNYKSIAEYPVKMQRLIAQRSWIESFDIKRVIVREGHVPMCFYFILSGSAIVSAMDDGVPKTIMFLNRGDSFGDVAILNNARRETTVISREKIELLCMTDTDFVDIFMSGGLRDHNDPFLNSIHFLDGWPKEKLIDNPKRCIFSYFKRGTILVHDSTKNDWIFVVKSGSASLLKKLHAVDIKKKPKPKKVMDFRDEVMEVMKHERFLSHEEQVQLMFEEEKRSLDDQNLHVRFYALPEINIKTNESYNELRQMKEEFMNANSVNRALGALEKSGVDVKSETGNSDSTQQVSDKRSRRKSIVNVLKGPFIKGGSSLGREASFASLPSRRDLESRPSESRNSRRSIASNQKSVRFVDQGESAENENNNVDDVVKKVDDWEQMSLPTLGESPINDLRIKPVEAKPVFVNARILTKGQVFGLGDMLFENQPHFSLVSNGSECIMIEKKFFLENASQRLMVALRESTFPYPSEEALQDNLETQMRWNTHKTKTINSILREVKMRKSDKNDARSTLKLPSLHV
ncbi:uncharacterized protein LOC132748342 [Ruditapes philippinarum]|uniref:uncharacterized protein LOC132748342 n=1 Tax=Ruditapes philippinarum TaxID=129788 RepID=UPI00295C0CBD|nr:uncharacterized protein LOC132748342 [Ruditapes philippinarum]